jgi:hypothetical protein
MLKLMRPAAELRGGSTKDDKRVLRQYESNFHGDEHHGDISSEPGLQNMTSKHYDLSVLGRKKVMQ